MTTSEASGPKGCPINRQIEERARIRGRTRANGRKTKPAVRISLTRSRIRRSGNPKRNHQQSQPKNL
jgi:hypothetical protein